MTRATACVLLSGPVAVLAMSCGAPSHSPADSAVGPVTTARNTQCAQVGHAVARYLSTGDNGGDRALDTKFAEDRWYILTSPTETRDGLIRADANYATTSCDKAVDAAAARETAQQVEDCHLNHGNYGPWGPNGAGVCRLPAATTAGR